MGCLAAQSPPASAATTPGTADAVRTNLVVNGIVYDPGRDVIYASVDDTDTTYPNRIVTIDPDSRAVIASSSVGTQPGALAMSADGTALFAGVDGQGAVKKLSLPGMTPQWSFTFGNYITSYVMLAGDIAVLPGSNDSIVVSRRVKGLSPTLAGLVVIDGGVARPTAGPSHIGSNSIAFDPDGVRLYGSDTESSGRYLYVNRIDSTGVANRTQHGGGGGDIVYRDGFLYSGNGTILDATGPTPTLSDTLSSSSTFSKTSVAVDPTVNRLYYTEQGYAGTSTTTIVAYDLTTRDEVASWKVTPHKGYSDRLIVTGANQLAYIDSGHPVAQEGNLVLLDLSTSPESPGSPEGEYTPLTPNRILDTRSGLGRDGIVAPVGPGQTIDVRVAGVGGLPTTGVSAVVLNVTAVTPTELGFLTVFPTGIPVPTISNLNFEPGAVVANLVTMPVGAGGQVSVYNPFGDVDVLFDVAGYYANATGPQGLRFHPLNPTRFMDTRNGTGGRLGALGAADSTTLRASGLLGVPSGAKAVALNVTVTGTTAPSFVSVFPNDVIRPGASNLNFGPDTTIANQAIVRLPADGVLRLYNAAGAADLIVDVVGYYDEVEFADKGRFLAVEPTRVVDTRTDSPFPTGWLPPGATLYTPDDAPISAYVLNVTVTETQGLGYVTVYPYTPNAEPPNASNVNYAADKTVPNHVIAPAGPSVGFYNAGGIAHLIVDLFGYFV